MRDNIIGVAEELLENLNMSKELAKQVRTRIQTIEDKLSSGTVSSLISEELNKLVSEDILRRLISEKITDNLLEAIISTYLLTKRDLLEILITKVVTSWLQELKETFVAETIRSEINQIFEEEADSYYQDVARCLVDNKLFQELLADIVSEVTTKKIEDKLELIEKLLTKKKVVTKDKKNEDKK